MRLVAILATAALLPLTPIAAPAQEMDWEWVRSAAGNADARRVAAAATGDVYVVGSYQDQLVLDTVTLTSNGSNDIFLLKLDPTGRAIWGRTFGGEWVEYCRAVAVDGAGNIYLGGEFCSNAVAFDSFVLINTRQTPFFDDSTFDVFTVKLDDDGDVLWARQGGGMYHDHVHDLCTDGSGNVCVFGRFMSGTILFDPLQLVNTGNIDLFLVKYDGGGEVRWARNAVGNGQENSWAVATDTQDNVYLAGSYRSSTLSFDLVTLTNTSDSFDLYVAKLDSEGNALWAVSAAGEDWDDANGLAIDDADQVYFAGHFASDSLRFDGATVHLSPSAGTNIDMYLARLDRDGRLAWVTSSEGGAWVYPHALAAHGRSSVTAMGTFNGLGAGHPETFGSSAITPVRSYDIFSVQYDVSGGARWCEALGGRGMDFGQDVDCDDAGSVYLAGFFDSDSLRIGSTLLINDYYNKMFVGKKVPSTSSVSPLSIDIPASRALAPHPNPFSRRITIPFAAGGEERPRVAIYDVAGRLIRELSAENDGGPGYVAIWDGRDAIGNRVPIGVYLARLPATRLPAAGTSTVQKLVLSR